MPLTFKNWIDISVIQENGKSNLLLLFEDQISADHALTVLTSQTFLVVTELGDERTKIEIRVTNSEFDMILISLRNKENYPPLARLCPEDPSLISCGWKTSQAGFFRLQPSVQLGTFHWN